MTLITTGAFDRDPNYVPITLNGFQTKYTATLNANNTTASIPLFSLTGAVEVFSLYGIVTKALSSSITAAYWQLNDQTATPDISLATGSTLSFFAVGSFVSRRNIASGAMNNYNANAGFVQDPVAATAPGIFMPFVMVQKSGGILTTVDFVYTTTNTPASGVIDFYIGWLPLTETSGVISM